LNVPDVALVTALEAPKEAVVATKEVTLALLDKLSSATGCVYKPVDIVLTALAEAEASKIKTKSDLENHALRKRALSSLVGEQERLQQNRESITQKMLQHLPAETTLADVQKLDEDWLANTYKKAAEYSDDEVQELWAKIIAGEVIQQGSFSRNTVNTLNNLDKHQLQLFETLCNLSFDCGSILIYESNDSFLKTKGLNFLAIQELEQLGLITTLHGGAQFLYKNPDGNGGLTFLYFDKLLFFETQNGFNLNMGMVRFSAAGTQLRTLVNRQPIEGWFEVVSQQIDDKNPSLSFSCCYNSAGLPTESSAPSPAQ
jgi:hypothetical protein